MPKPLSVQKSTQTFAVFNIETLSPSWKLSTFLEALYFSIFYMKPGIELYKECENPNCKHDKYFLINATITNKKYCCPACAKIPAAPRPLMPAPYTITAFFIMSVIPVMRNASYKTAANHSHKPTADSKKLTKVNTRTTLTSFQPPSS